MTGLVCSISSFDERDIMKNTMGSVGQNTGYHTQYPSPFKSCFSFAQFQQLVERVFENHTKATKFSHFETKKERKQMPLTQRGNCCLWPGPASCLRWTGDGESSEHQPHLLTAESDLKGIISRKTGRGRSLKTVPIEFKIILNFLVISHTINKGRSSGILYIRWPWTKRR